MCLYICASVQFRFSTCNEVLMMIIGSVCAVLHGSAQPLMLLVFGLLTEPLSNKAAGATQDVTQIRPQKLHITLRPGRVYQLTC